MPKVARKVRRGLVCLSVLVATYWAVCFYFWTIQDHAIFMPLEKIAQTPANLVPPLTFEKVEIPVNGSVVHGFWLPADEGAPVALYLHGQDANIGKNLDHAGCLHQLGCHVLVIDYRGFGRTYGALTPSEHSVYQDADAAWHYLIKSRKLTPERILIYGHSLGGAIAIELATRHPDAGGLVAESTFTSLKNMARWKRTVTNFLPLELILRHRFESIDKLRMREVPPVLFIHGTNDSKVPCSMCAELHDATAEPNKDMLLIPGGMHAQRGPGQALYETKMADFISRHFDH